MTSCFSVVLQLVVSVEVEGGNNLNVTVREGAPVITVMFRVAEAAGLTLVPTSSLFEIATQLKLRELYNIHLHIFEAQHFQAIAIIIDEGA